MARIRSVRPETWSDPVFCALTAEARLLYIALWNYCDDQGRGRFLPKSIEGFAFPRETVDVDGLLGELVGAGRIRVYESNGEEFFFVPKWGRHQKPNRPTPSNLPEPPPGVSEDDMNPHVPVSEPSVSHHVPVTEPSVRPQGQDLGHRKQDLGTTYACGLDQLVDNSERLISEVGDEIAAAAAEEVGFRLGRPSEFAVSSPGGLVTDLARRYAADPKLLEAHRGRRADLEQTDRAETAKGRGAQDLEEVSGE